MRALVIMARSLACGYLGCYGNEWVDTPTLDRLAAQGIVFDQHFADHPDPSVAEQVWQTGCYHFPGTASYSPCAAFPLLGERGITTYWITAAPPTLSQGWHTILTLLSETSASPVLQAVAKALGDLATRDEWLLRIDLASLLPPWQVPPEFCDRCLDQQEEEEPSRESGVDVEFLRLQHEYAAGVTYLDHVLGKLLEVVDKTTPIDDLLLLFTSDRGNDSYADAAGLGEELIHLPLLMRLPRRDEAGRRIAALTQPCDLLPTLMEAFGLPLPALHGKSVLPLVHGQTESVRPYACAGLSCGERVDWILRTPEWSFLLSRQPSVNSQGIPRLFAKPEDRWEVNDVAQHHLELVEQMTKTLDAFVEATRRPGPFEPPQLPREEELVKVTAEDSANPMEGGNPP
jgi:hypothetical protein